MRRTTASGTTLVLAAFLAAVVARAADDGVPVAPTPVAEPSPWLFGDWNGERTRLKDRGIDFQFGYTGEAAYNATGGIEEDAAYADQYVAGVTLDLEKLVGLSAAQFQATITQRTGRNLSDDAELGTLQQVQEVYRSGPDDPADAVLVSPGILPAELVDWKVGRMGVGEDFASFSCDFQNLTFCGSDPGNIVGDYIYNWPISQWGTRLKFKLENFGYVQAGVYDVNPEYLGRQQGAAAGVVFRLDRRTDPGGIRLAPHLRRRRPGGQLQGRRVVRHVRGRRRRRRRQRRPVRYLRPAACRATEGATAPTSISSRTSRPI